MFFFLFNLSFNGMCLIKVRCFSMAGSSDMTNILANMVIVEVFQHVLLWVFKCIYLKKMRFILDGWKIGSIHFYCYDYQLLCQFTHLVV